MSIYSYEGGGRRNRAMKDWMDCHRRAKAGPAMAALRRLGIDAGP